MSEPDEAISGAVRQIVADYALDRESLHASWRCEHPDVYGPCNCVDEFVADAVETLAAHMADREADAWDEGYEAGLDDGDDVPRDANPFRLTPDTEGETDE